MAPVVPGYVPFAFLLAVEATAVLISVLVLARGERSGFGALLVCPRCARLHERAETVAALADAVAVGALAFLVALPFVAAGYESALTIPRLVLAVSAVIAVLAVAAEADFFARIIAARILPNFTWSVTPARLLGGGARWLGVILALYLFQRPDLPGSGIAGLFGGVGALLARELSSTSAIYAAAAMLLVAALTSLTARWLLPFALNSLPLTMAAPPGASGR